MGICNKTCILAAKMLRISATRGRQTMSCHTMSCQSMSWHTPSMIILTKYTWLVIFRLRAFNMEEETKEYRWETGYEKVNQI